jgi:thiosulfate dehydrogenase [quinone] large subunit
MPDSSTCEKAERALLFILRILIGWEFLYAAIQHYSDSSYVGHFLAATKTFHPIYGPMATSAFLPVIAFLVEYGHLLIGLSFISGLFIRASAPFAALLMLTYWTAHMNFPYIDNVNNYITDYHITNIAVIAYLFLKGAGHIYGLDCWASKLPFVKQNSWLRCIVG